MGKKQKSFVAAGVMSGTSVDGLDIALCRFERMEHEKRSGEASNVKRSGSGEAACEKSSDEPWNEKSSDGFAGNSKIEEQYQWDFKILKTRSLSYSGTGWPERLANAETADGCALMEIHRDFGRFTGEAVNNFLADAAIDSPSFTGPDSVGFPGSTTYHGEGAAPAITGNDKPHFSQPGNRSGANSETIPVYGKNDSSGAKTFQGVDLIASHGHTIFHRPEKGITLQIGDGAEIAAVTGITTVSDFRRLDVALGGQGAPLVPVGDELLFGSYDFCLNLGGFANISFRESGKRVAFDICPVNIVLNRLARTRGQEYDKGGETARSGKVIQELLRELENLEFYRTAGPRSLGKEWVEEVFVPVMDHYKAPAEDKMRTVCEHIALRIAAVTGNPVENAGEPFAQGNNQGQLSEKIAEKSSGSETGSATLFATGGGAKNVFLMELIAHKTAPVQVVIPEEEIVDFKEAIVFAFLGVLRIRNEPNCLASVTGARHDNSGGIIHFMTIGFNTQT